MEVLQRSGKCSEGWAEGEFSGWKSYREYENFLKAGLRVNYMRGLLFEAALLTWLVTGVRDLQI